MEDIRLISPRTVARWLWRADSGRCFWRPTWAADRHNQPPRESRTSKSTAVDLLTDDDGQLVEEIWEAHFLRGAKVGHRQTRIYELPDTDPPLLRIVATDRLEMRRFGDVTQQELTLASLETVAGQVRQMAYQLTGAATGRRRRRAPSRVRRPRWSADCNSPRRRSDPSLGNLHGHRTTKAFLPCNDLSLGNRCRQAKSGSCTPFFRCWIRRHRSSCGRSTWKIRVATTPDRRLLRVEAWDPGASFWGWKVPRVYWTDDAGQIWKSQEPSFLDRQTCPSESSRGDAAE